MKKNEATINKCFEIDYDDDGLNSMHNIHSLYNSLKMKNSVSKDMPKNNEQIRISLPLDIVQQKSPLLKSECLVSIKKLPILNPV